MPIPSRRLYIFDLDGTLVDSLSDIANAANEALALLGMAPHAVSAYRFMVGEGVPRLAERALGAAQPRLVARMAQLTRAIYRTRLVEHTRPYAGIVPLLASLRQHGAYVAVLTNKPHHLTPPILRALFAEDTFDAVLGYRTEGARKPDPAGLLHICTTLNIAPADAWMIGDTAVDIEAARRAGAGSIGVTWGFRPQRELEAAGADFIVDRPEQLLPLR